MSLMKSKAIETPLLKKVEDGIEAKLEGKAKGQYQAILLSGLQIMFGAKTRHLLEQKLQQEGDIVAKVSSGIAQLVGTVYQQSDGKMSIPEAVPAGIVLAMYALDFAQKAGMIDEMSNELVAEVTQATAKAILEVFGIDRARVQEAIAQRGAPAEEPVASEQEPTAQPGGLMMSGV